MRLPSSSAATLFDSRFWRSFMVLVTKPLMITLTLGRSLEICQRGTPAVRGQVTRINTSWTTLTSGHLAISPWASENYIFMRRRTRIQEDPRGASRR